MRRIIFLLWICCLSLSPSAFAMGSSQHSHTYHSKSAKKSKAKKSKSSSNKAVHVSGYTKKDGTYVAPYDRAEPGTGAGRESSAASAFTTRMPYHPNHIASGFTADPSVRLDKHGKIKRSAAARDAFKRGHPCPATGRRTGSCPGYVIDHVQPLECGGADAPSNMQWQTVAEGKAKDKTERYCR